jgi:hypothetical protein
MPDREDDFEEAWARIVEELTAPADDAAEGAHAPGPTAQSPEQPRARGTEPGTGQGLEALFEPLRRAQPTPPAQPDADPGAFVDNWADEGHFVPPPPPEIPTGTPLKRLAWAGLLGGPATMALSSLTPWDPPRIVIIAAALAALAGFVTLVWLMPDSREDGWDDGARV